MQTRKYPRTMQEAFGPYCSPVFHERNEFNWTPVRVAMAVTYALALAVLVCVL